VPQNLRSRVTLLLQISYPPFADNFLALSHNHSMEVFGRCGPNRLRSKKELKEKIFSPIPR
jgi:hypothetical protein